MTEENKNKPEENESTQADKKTKNTKKEIEQTPKNNNSSGATFLFLILFLITFGLLVYTQFYQGDGKFNWSLSKNGEAVNNEKITDLNNQISALTIENEQLKSRISDLQSELDQFSMPEQDWMLGVSYEVNIGTFKYFNMKWYEDNFVQMRMYKDGEYESFTIGRFRDLENARKFREDIQRIGIADAFIVKRTDGRITERIYN